MRILFSCLALAVVGLAMVPEADGCGQEGGGLFSRRAARRAARSGGMMMTAGYSSQSSYSYSERHSGPPMLLMPAPMMQPRVVPAPAPMQMPRRGDCPMESSARPAADRWINAAGDLDCTCAETGLCLCETCKCDKIKTYSLAQAPPVTGP